MKEKQIWLRLFLFIAILLALVLPSTAQAEEWFCTNGYPAGWDISDLGTYYCPVLGDFDNEDDEADVQIYISEDYTWSNTLVKVLENSFNGTTEITSRVNGVTGNQSISIPAGTVGEFTDAVNTDTLSPGDLIAYELVTSNSTGGTITIPFISSTLDGDKSIIATVNASGGLSSVGDGDITYYAVTGFTSARSTESQVEYTVGSATTLSDLRVYVKSNSLDASANFTLRINGAAGNSQIIIDAAETGSLVDSVNTDSISPEDEIAFELSAGGSSGTISISTAQITSDSSAQQTGLSHGSSSAILTATAVRYFSLGGNITSESATENTTKQDLKGDYTAKNLFVNVTVNTTDGDSTFRVRKNGENTDIVVTVPQNTTGVYSDTTNTADFTSGDYINYMVTAGSGSGDLYFKVMGIELEPLGDGWTNSYTGVSGSSIAYINGVDISTIANINGQ